MDFLSRLFDTSDFPPRWFCGRWSEGHGWLHILSDLGVWSAYVAIPCVLGYFILRRSDLPFRKIFLLFGAFILACGTTHLMEALIFWWPAYRLAGLIKLATAIISWATVLALIPVVPRVLSMRTPEELEREIDARKKAETALHQVNDELEQRIVERTAELTHANETLRTEQERFQVMANSIPQLAWMARADGHIYWYNRRWYEYTGTTFEQMEGWGWQRVHDPAELPRVLIKFKSHLASGEPWEDTFPLRRYDGQMRWHLSRAVPVRNAQGEILTWFGTNTDITERREMEEALREADRRKDDFLAVLSHELRNPLAPIRNGLYVMAMAGDDREAIESARAMMVRQVEQLVHLVDDLLDVSRISRGKIRLRRERTELSVALHSALETTRPAIDAAAHQLTVTLPSEPLYVDGDTTRLAQVFSNLLGNSAKYTPPGGRIQLSAVQEGTEIVVRVADNGVGISAEMLERVFEMFSQGDRSPERTQGGLGIGLTIVRRLVELHGGTVVAHSDGPGKGSEFVVRLPAASPTREETPSVSRVENPPVATVPRRILVVDDNKDAARSLSLALRRMGHEVRTASDGLEAIAEAEAYRPDVIFMDIGMPRLDGYGATRRIREQPWGCGMLIVALTGWGQEEDKARSREAGCDVHLTKPAELTSLAKLLAECSSQK